MDNIASLKFAINEIMTSTKELLDVIETGDKAAIKAELQDTIMILETFSLARLKAIQGEL